MNPIILKIASMFINKRRVIGWVSALAIAAGAVAAGMDSKDFKDAVCSAPVLEKVPEAK